MLENIIIEKDLELNKIKNFNKIYNEKEKDNN